MMLKNKNFEKGQIVLIPFPFTDLGGSKVRPALILNSQNSEDIIVTFISSNIDKVGLFDVIIDKDENNNLKVKSKIVCSKIATLDKKIILGEIGKLSDKMIGEVNMMIAKVFEL